MTARNRTRNTPAAPAAPAAPVTPDAVTPDAVPTLADQVAAYRAGDTKVKAAMRKGCNDRMAAASRTGDMTGWNAANTELQAYLVKSDLAKAAVDPATVLRDRVTVLIGAALSIMAGDVTPDGLDVSTVDLAATFPDYVRFSVAAGLPYGTSDGQSDAVTKLAAVRVTRTQSGERNDVPACIIAALSDAKVGEKFTIRQVAAQCEKPGDTPWDGRVNARFFGGAGVDGFVAIEKTATTPRMIEKV